MKDEPMSGIEKERQEAVDMDLEQDGDIDMTNSDASSDTMDVDGRSL